MEQSGRARAVIVVAQEKATVAHARKLNRSAWSVHVGASRHADYGHNKCGVIDPVDDAVAAPPGGAMARQRRLERGTNAMRIL